MRLPFAELRLSLIFLVLLAFPGIGMVRFSSPNWKRSISCDRQSV